MTSALFLCVKAELAAIRLEIETIEWAGLPEDERRLRYLKDYAARLQHMLGMGQYLIPQF